MAKATVYLLFDADYGQDPQLIGVFSTRKKAVYEVGNWYEPGDWDTKTGHPCWIEKWKTDTTEKVGD